MNAFVEDLLKLDIEKCCNVRLETVVSRLLGDRTSINATFKIACKVLEDKIPGVFVEAGVAYGASCGAMAIAMEYINQIRGLHAFDSFEGIPMAGPRDVSQPGIGEIVHDKNAPLRDRLVSSGISGSSVEAVKAHWQQWGLNYVPLICHKGWFQDTLPGKSNEWGFNEIAMLRLDSDLVESFECCLEHLYPLVSKGGWVIIDDWTLGNVSSFILEWLKTNNHDVEIIEPISSYGSACWKVI